MRTRFLVGVLLSALLLACAEPPPEPVRAPIPDEPESREFFTDVAVDAGIDFVHDNGLFGEFHMAEIFGAGVALFDADGDGDLDVYLVQGGPLQDRGALERDAPDELPSDVLYRNDSEDGALRFVDVTAESGLQARGYGMGVSAGDVDDDGRVDLYVANFGSNQLWRNVGENGEIAFVDVTAAARADDPRWSVPAVFFDEDGDGRLDLFVGNFLSYNHSHAPICRTPRGDREHCAAARFGGLPDRLLRNRTEPGGPPVFHVATIEANLVPLGFSGRALAAVAADFDADGRQDLYVANDNAANHLWRNTGHDFEDVALDSRVALQRGSGQGSHSVAVADPDDDGDLDLFVAATTVETNLYYRNRGGDAGFEDLSEESGLGPASRNRAGFGAGFLDVDGDGRLDLFVANGAVRAIQAQIGKDEPLPLRQGDHLYVQRATPENEDRSPFREVSTYAGTAFEHTDIGRGAAFGDLDDDGDVDVVVNNNGGPARLHVNHSDPPRWLGVRLLLGRRDAYGASATLKTTDGREMHRLVAPGGSYASSSDPRLVWALPDGIVAAQLTIRRPDGAEISLAPPPENRYSDVLLD